MTEAELRALLDRSGLGRVSDAILAVAAPTVRIFVRRTADESLPAGASKLGGLPDLPSDVDWPAWHEPMAFIGQFNLREVAPHEREGVLPRTGLLSFFFETSGEPLHSAGLEFPDVTDFRYPEFDERRGWRVLYSPDDPATFTRRALTEGLNEWVRFPACAARFAAEVTLPADVGDPACQPMVLSPAERDALFTVLTNPRNAINRGPWEDGGHHLLGYPFNLDGDARVLAAVRDDPTLGEREAAVAGQWRSLLQVDSSSDTEMDWAGGGLLQWCVEKDALRRSDFSRVWVIMQFL